MGEDANNTPKSTSLPGGITVVDTVFEIGIILGLPYHSRESRSRSAKKQIRRWPAQICHYGYKSRSRSSKVTLMQSCNASIRPTKLSNVKSISNEPTL